MADLDQPRRKRQRGQSRRKPPNAESGTALANIDTISSVGSGPVNHGWGGARNRADLPSWHLSRDKCEGLLAATRHAERIGCPFNRHWTVHYEKAGIAERDATRFIGHLLKLVRAHVLRKQGVFTAIWVRENGEGKGGHIHIVMHVPALLSLRGLTGKWVRLAGGKVMARVSRVRSIGGRLKTAENGGEHYRENLAAVLAYVLKGASREAGEALGIVRSGERGLVIGKRCGWTQNVGERAQGKTSNADDFWTGKPMGR